MSKTARSEYMANSLIQEGFEKVNIKQKERKVNTNKARKEYIYFLLGIMLIACADGIVTFITYMVGA